MPTHRSLLLPDVPEALEDIGIPQSLATDIVLRYSREQGVASLAALRRELKLSFPVVDAIFQQLRKLQLVEVKGTAGNDYVFSLTSAGRKLASERAEICRYTGPVPVSLAQYKAVVRSQVTAVSATRDAVRQALDDLVIPRETIDQLGPALKSQRSMLIYGPTGSGKTSIAERLPKVFGDTVLVPYAVEVDGHIIRVFDPVIHHPLDLEPDDLVDARWVRCSRPFVTAGGELVSSMLGLRYDEASGVYVAPPQMKANNGIFLIDDFGRQQIAPRDLLNRWIIPLDRRVDYLELRNGISFQIPFELVVIFSTNLDPADLADEAFLRRIPNKVYIQPVTDSDFDEIFAQALLRRGILPAPGAVQKLRQVCRRFGASELRACYPNDICDILHWIGAYEGTTLEITEANLERAAGLYFAQAEIHRAPVRVK